MYSAALQDASGNTRHDDGRERVGFENFTIETIIRAIADAGETQYASQLWARYCDFHRVVRHVMETIVATPVGETFDRGNQGTQVEA